jgi:hypothetical protein
VSTFADLGRQIEESPARCGLVRLVAIDGHGGAGKSTFAAHLAAALGDAPTIHTDDFASWQEPIEWWPRLEAEVLKPLQSGAPVRYRAYDWDSRELGAERELPIGEVVLIEGVSSARRAVTARLSVAIWVESPRQVSLARGIARDGEPMREQWLRWLADEEAFYARDPVAERADLIVDGAPSLAYDPDTEFVTYLAPRHP